MRKISLLILVLLLSITAYCETISGTYKCKVIFHYSNMPFGKDEVYKCKLHLWETSNNHYLAILSGAKGYHLSIGEKTMNKIVFSSNSVLSNGDGELQVNDIAINADGIGNGSAEKTYKFGEGELKITGSQEALDPEYKEIFDEYTKKQKRNIPSTNDYSGAWEGVIKSHVGGMVNRMIESPISVKIQKIKDYQYGGIIIYENVDYPFEATVSPTGYFEVNKYYDPRPQKLKIDKAEITSNSMQGKGEIYDFTVWNSGSLKLAKSSISLDASSQKRILQYLHIVPQSPIQKPTASTTTIGKQTWMTSNLDVATYRDGAAITNATNSMEWKRCNAEKRGCWCYYNYDESNAQKYGKLYNWYAVNTRNGHGGIAPGGFHVPTSDEQQTLISFLGGADIAATKLKKNEGWYSNGNGNNSSNWNGLPGGMCDVDGAFTSLEQSGLWWSCSGRNETGYQPVNGKVEVRITALAWYFAMSYNKTEANINKDVADYGFSVRCLKD